MKKATGFFILMGLLVMGCGNRASAPGVSEDKILIGTLESAYPKASDNITQNTIFVTSLFLMAKASLSFFNINTYSKTTYTK